MIVFNHQLSDHQIAALEKVEEMLLNSFIVLKGCPSNSQILNSLTRELEDQAATVRDMAEGETIATPDITIDGGAGT